MNGASAGSNDGDGSDSPVRRLARAGKSRAARATKDVVERAMRPTTTELAARTAALAAEHQAVAEDLGGLHAWLDWRFGELEADTRVDELTGLVEGLERRLTELHQDVRALDRHVRRLADQAIAAESPSPEGRGRAPVDDVFDYDAFERRFRGEPETIFAEQIARYADLVAGHEPVVEIGCGRGGFLAALRARGVAVVGVEPNADMAALARDGGIEVHEQYAGEYLRSVADESLGAIVSFQVVEHLEMADLVELVDLAAQKLCPGGVFLAETPNPASWIVLHTSFLLDPTHVRPIHPGLMSFLCERAGLTDIRVDYFAPADTMHLSTLDDAPPWAARLNEGIERLNAILFGPQDYAVVARAPDSSKSAARP